MYLDTQREESHAVQNTFIERWASWMMPHVGGGSSKYHLNIVYRCWGRRNVSYRVGESTIETTMACCLCWRVGRRITKSTAVFSVLCERVQDQRICVSFFRNNMLPWKPLFFNRPKHLQGMAGSHITMTATWTRYVVECLWIISYLE